MSLWQHRYVRDASPTGVLITSINGVLLPPGNTAEASSGGRREPLLTHERNGTLSTPVGDAFQARWHRACNRYHLRSASAISCHVVEASVAFTVLQPRRSYSHVPMRKKSRTRALVVVYSCITVEAKPASTTWHNVHRTEHRRKCPARCVTNSVT